MKNQNTEGSARCRRSGAQGEGAKKRVLSGPVGMDTLVRALLADERAVVLLTLGVLRSMAVDAAAMPAVLPAVTRLLDHADSDIQRAALETLAGVGGQALADALPRLATRPLGREQLEVLLRAFVALGEPCDDAVFIAAAACRHHRGAVRKLALQALEALSAPMPVLVSCVRLGRCDRHAGVRSLARRMADRLVIVA
jgi:hypothetical protein